MFSMSIITEYLGVAGGDSQAAQSPRGCVLQQGSVGVVMFPGCVIAVKLE